MAEIDKTPIPGGPVNQPASGTYGEKAATSRLKSQLPPMPGGVPGEGAGPPGAGGGSPVSLPAPGPGPVAPGAESPIPGVPAGIIRPTSRPGVPVNSPFDPSAGSPMPPSMTPSQERLNILDALSQHPDPEVSEWASLVKEALIAGSTQ